MKKKLYYLLLTTITMTQFPFTTIGQDLPKSGDLIITEFMANPGAVSDSRGEWIELLNISTDTLLLNGLLVKDDGSNDFTISGAESIILSPGHYFLISRNGNPDENGGIFPDYIYSNFTLGNSEDEIIICLPDGVVLEQVNYDKDWTIVSGASFELGPEYLDAGFNSEPGKWSLATTPYGNGDLGSPGEANSASTRIDQQVVIEELEIYPNPCFGILNFHMKLQKKNQVEICLVNLVGQEVPIYDSRPCDEISMQIDTDWLEKGVWIVKINLGEKTEIFKILVF